MCPNFWLAVCRQIPFKQASCVVCKDTPHKKKEKYFTLLFFWCFFMVCAKVSVYCRAQPVNFSSCSVCESVFSTKQNHPRGIASQVWPPASSVWQDWSVDLNRTLSRREKKRPSDGVTLMGISQTGSDQPVQPSQSTSRYGQSSTLETLHLLTC